MSYEVGALKWIIGMLLTPVGYVSLYIFGDGIWNTITHIRSLVIVVQNVNQPDILVQGLLAIYIPSPDAVLESLVLYPLVGGVIGAALWYSAVKP